MIDQQRSDNIKFIRKYLKRKLIRSTDGFKGHEKERNQVYGLLKRTIEKGESNSALIIGPPSSGKTTLIKDVIKQLEAEIDMKSNAIIIHLNGLIHTDDNLALRSTAAQMNISDVNEKKVYGTFAANLSYLLSCLKSGQRETSKSLIFIIEEFDMFCNHSNQTLLYNLLDMTHNSPIPICIIGLTCRLDVTELFEKRVKSRFSHRQIFIFPENGDQKNSTNNKMNRIKNLLLHTDELNKDDRIKHGSFIQQWNEDIEILITDKKLQETIDMLYDITVDEKNLKNLLINVISKLNEENISDNILIKDKLTIDDFLEEFKNFNKDDKIQVLEDLSVLEICLLIAMKHHCEIYDYNPFNFEMILTRYNKFANSNTLTNVVPRPVVMKAFEHIVSLELISPVGSTGHCLQKEYQLYKLLFLPKQINEAIKNYNGLPTEVHQWSSSSIS